jgi:hypothetical protein
MKTFKDLKFKLHPLSIKDNEKQAKLYFENGYGVSVICGTSFYSNGIDSYEVACLDKDGSLVNPPKTVPFRYNSGVIGWLRDNEITTVMKAMQRLK